MMLRISRFLPVLGFSVLLLSVVGCSSPTKSAKPTYHRPLNPGEHALRKVDPSAVRTHLVTAFDDRESGLSKALDQSAVWYAAPSSQTRFPFRTQNGSISHDQARKSVVALKESLTSSVNGERFAQSVLARFDVYQTVGWDSEGTVLFTGYYAPIFEGSPVRTERFDHPIHKRPEWLLTCPKGVPFGRRLDNGRIVDSPERHVIESSGMLEGTELCWLDTKLDAYICQVNGSACIRYPDGSLHHVGYAGKTEHPYTGLGASMLEAGIMTKEGLSLDAIQAHNEHDPETINRMIARNKNFVFFQHYAGDTWPAGSLGVPVTDRASIATDKSVYPPGAVALVNTDVVDGRGGKRPFVRLVCDQDTGGAIVAPGRCDLFMGISPEARTLAGGQYAEGTMYYFFLKPQIVASFDE